MDFETTDHLFLHCPKSAEIWAFFLKKFSLGWVMPRSCKDLLKMRSLCPTESLSQKGTVVWKILPSLMWWHIWKMRNARIFDNDKVFLAPNKLYLIAGWVGHMPLFRNIKVFQWRLEWDNIVFQ